MTPEQLKTAGIRLYGRKHWKHKLSKALAVDVSTIHRMCARPEIAGPYEVAIKGMLQNKRAQEAVEKEARALGLVPRKRRKKIPKPKSTKSRTPKKEKRVEEDAVADRPDPAVELDPAGAGDRVPDPG